MHSHLTSDLGAELPLHLSLSRPNVLATAQREGFVELLEERVEKARICPFVLPPLPWSIEYGRIAELMGVWVRFEVAFTGFEWVCNTEQTRWFLVLKVAAPGKDVCTPPNPRFPVFYPY